MSYNPEKDTVSGYQINNETNAYDDDVPLLSPEELKKVNAFQKWSKGLLSVGLCILVGFILGLIGAISVQFGFQAALEENVFDSKILIRGSLAYNSWLRTGSTEKHASSSRVFAKAIMLNLTNPDEFLAGQLPIYNELPFVIYEKISQKINISQSLDNATITYRENIQYVPDLEDSEIDPKTTYVTNINPSYLTIMFKDGGEKNLVSRMISSTILDIINKLTRDYVFIAFQGSRGPVLNERFNNISKSLDEFCNQWINGQPQTEGDWKDMTLRIFDSDAPANVTVDACKSLWTSGNEYALNENVASSLAHADVWIKALHGDETATSFILSKFPELNADGLQTIITWLHVFDRKVTWFWIKNKIFEVRKPFVQGDLYAYEDLGFLQWGQGAGNPFDADKSVQDILNLPSTPELYYMAKSIYLDFHLDIPTSKRIVPLFTERHIAKFIDNYENKNFASIIKEWDLTQDQIEALFKYMNFVRNNFFVTRLRKFGENNKALLSTRTIHEWLIEYNDEFLELVERKYLENDLVILKNIENDKKDSIISTGALDLNKASHIILYEGTTTLPWVGDNGENITVIGSDGTQFHSNLLTGDFLRLWVPETMRTRELIYDSTVDRLGISVYKFKEAEYMWKKNATYEDFYDGQSNMTMFGTPLFVGNWRFYGSDPVWKERINGIPDAIEKESISVFEVEPYTGLTFDKKKRYQINYHLPNNTGWLDVFHPQISKNATLFPIVMIEESSTISQQNADIFKKELPTTVFLRDILYWIMVALCLSCFAVGGTITMAAFALKNRALGKTK